MTAYQPQVHTERTGRRGGNSSGFTLVELIVVVVIIGVLAAIAIGTYHSYVDKAKKTVAISSLDTIRKNLEFYYNDYSGYPQGIDFDTGKEPGGITVFEPLLRDQIRDDLVPVSYLYNSAIKSYTLTARAKDSDQTLYTLTPDSLSN